MPRVFTLKRDFSQSNLFPPKRTDARTLHGDLAFRRKENKVTTNEKMDTRDRLERRVTKVGASNAGRRDGR